MSPATVAGVSDLESARKCVLETTELLELILTLLPMRNIFGVIRVSKYWKTVINNSSKLQRRMFLRLSNKPREHWAVGQRTIPTRSARNAQENSHSNASNLREIMFRRVNTSVHPQITYFMPVVANPMLRDTNPRKCNCVEIYPGSKQIRESRISFGCRTWVNLRERNDSFFNTYLTDPPCYMAMVNKLTLYLGSYDAKTGKWTPPDVPAEDYEDDEDASWQERSFQIRLCGLASGQDSYISVVENHPSIKPPTMGPLVKAAFDTRGLACCHTPRSAFASHGRGKRAMLYNTVGRTFPRAVDLVPKSVDRSRFVNYCDQMADVYEVLRTLQSQLRANEMPKWAYMSLYCEARSRYGMPKIILPSDAERDEANAEWDPSR